MSDPLVQFFRPLLSLCITKYYYCHTSGCIVFISNFLKPDFIRSVTDSCRYMLSSLLPYEWMWHCFYPIGGAGKDMACLYFSNPEYFWNNLFVTNQYRNEVSLHFWISWVSCPQRLVKETYFTGFIWRGKLNSWLLWYIFIQCHSFIPSIILPFFPFQFVMN